MRVVLLGSRGYIGGHFLSALKQSARFQILAPSRLELDLRDSVRTDQFLAESKPDLVVNCAVKVTDIEQSVTSALNIIRAMPRKSLYFQVGSGAEYSRDCCPPGAVESDFGGKIPRDSYGISKYLVAASLEAGLKGRFLNLRTFGVFGDGEEARRLIPSLVNSALSSRIASIKNDGLMSYVSVNDLTRFLLGWIDRGCYLRGNYNFSGRSPLQLKDVLYLIGRKISPINIEILEECHSKPYYGNSSALLAAAPWFDFLDVWSEIERYIDRLTLNHEMNYRMNKGDGND